MPILWQDSIEDPKQEFVVGWLEDDVFTYIWSRKNSAKIKPFRDTVRIRSEGMGGKTTTHTHQAMMQIAWEKLKNPLIARLITSRIQIPAKWFWVHHQYGCGTENNHLLVRPDNAHWIQLWITDKNNALIHSVCFTQASVGDRVFQLLSQLRDAMVADNKQHGHWHDVLQSRE